MAAALSAAPARAEQLVLFDITYTHTNANDSHYGISGATLKQPSNWTSPINYAQGTIHFYQEVMTKPSDKDTIIDFCLISMRGYGCIETVIYKHTGVVETMRSMAGDDVYPRSAIDFTRAMRSIQLVLKTPAPTYINGGRPQSDFLPSKMRFVATLVPPGDTYVKPTPTPGFNPGDGGAPAPAAAAGTPTPGADAGTPVTPAADGGAPVDPPPAKADAAASTPPPSRPDAAASKPPTMTNPPPDDEPEEEPRPATRAAGGCSSGGTPMTGGLLLLLAALALPAALRRLRASTAKR
jgi:hypothetical protein